MDYFLWSVALLCIAVGLFGTVLPLLPGIPLIFGGALIAAWIDDFAFIGWPSLLLLGVLTGAGIAVDFIAAALGAKRIGASRQAIIGSTIGAVTGIFFGLPGILFGPFVGACAGELTARADILRAGQVGVATWIGIIIGAAAKLAIAFSMTGIVVLAYYF